VERAKDMGRGARKEVMPLASDEKGAAHELADALSAPRDDVPDAAASPRPFDAACTARERRGGRSRCRYRTRARRSSSTSGGGGVWSARDARVEEERSGRLRTVESCRRMGSVEGFEAANWVRRGRSWGEVDGVRRLHLGRAALDRSSA